MDCDLSIYHVCGIGTFDGQPATSSFYHPTSGGDFVGDCFVYESVDELIELLDGSGTLTLHHTDATICPPNGNWWRNQGFGSNGNPWHIDTDWALDCGTSVYADLTRGGKWSAFWAGWAGSGRHRGDIADGSGAHGRSTVGLSCAAAGTPRPRPRAGTAFPRRTVYRAPHRQSPSAGRGAGHKLSQVRAAFVVEEQVHRRRRGYLNLVLGRIQSSYPPAVVWDFRLPTSPAIVETVKFLRAAIAVSRHIQI